MGEPAENQIAAGIQDRHASHRGFQRVERVGEKLVGADGLWEVDLVGGRAGCVPGAGRVVALRAFADAAGEPEPRSAGGTALGW